MFTKRLFILTIFLLISTNLFSQSNKIDNFFVKIQEKKLERLKEKISNLDKNTQESIISVISKYDKKIFSIRKTAMMYKINKKNCSKRLEKIENQLKIRRKIINLQLKKIEELKKLNLDCKIVAKVVSFERKFMMKLRRKMRQRKHKRFNKKANFDAN